MRRAPAALLLSIAATAAGAPAPAPGPGAGPSFEAGLLSAIARSLPHPPVLLFLSLHGDKSVGNASNALARFRLSGGSAGGDGSVPFTAVQLPSILLTPSHERELAEKKETPLTAVQMPRGIALLGTDTLLIASATDEVKGGDKGRIIATSGRAACAAGGGMHGPPLGSGGDAILPVHAMAFAAAEMNHPYGIAVTPPPSTVLVSNQGDGRTVPLDPTPYLTDLLPAAAAGQPWPAPPNCVDSADGPGTTGVRGIAVSADGALTYVACKDDDSVRVYSTGSGAVLATLRDPAIRQPISLLWGKCCGGREGLFVGGEAPPVPGLGKAARQAIVHVAFLDVGEGRVTRRFWHSDGGGHSAGMVRVGGALLVLGQEQGALYQFDAESGGGGSDGGFVACLVDGLVRPEAVMAWTGLCSV